MPKSQPVRRTFDIVKAKAKLAESGKTYVDLAKPLGYERQAVGHWFRGRGEPDVRQMKAMARELSCHWLELVTDDATVVYKEEEVQRLEKLRSLGGSELQELDAFIEFKIAQKAKEKA